MSNVTTPLPNVIEKALRNLLPTEVPDYSADDLEYLAGVTAADLMSAAFPHETPVREHNRAPDETAMPAWAWSKRCEGVLFALSPRSRGAVECILLQVPAEHQDAAENILFGGWINDWYRFVRALPPTAMLGWFPDRKQGLAALDKAHSDSPSLEKKRTALVMHAQIARSSLETVAGLAQSILDERPDDGEVKLLDATDPKNLARATEEARHALDVRSPKPLLGKSNAAD